MFTIHTWKKFKSGVLQRQSPVGCERVSRVTQSGNITRRWWSPRPWTVCAPPPASSSCSRPWWGDCSREKRRRRRRWERARTARRSARSAPWTARARAETRRRCRWLTLPRRWSCSSLSRRPAAPASGSGLLIPQTRSFRADPLKPRAHVKPQKTQHLKRSQGELPVNLPKRVRLEVVYSRIMCSATLHYNSGYWFESFELSESNGSHLWSRESSKTS